MGFSPAPFNISPFPGPPEIPPSLTVDVEVVVVDGAGDCGFDISDAIGALLCICSAGTGVGSSAGWTVIFVPSVHSIVSGAQSSSSSSISAQFAFFSSESSP